MYTKVSSPTLYIFDAATNESLSTVKFELPVSTEQILLQLVNFNKIPSSLFITNVDIIPNDKNYLSEIAKKNVTRRGILRALYTDYHANTTDAIDIQFLHDVRAYEQSRKNTNHFESVNDNNIVIESVKPVQLNSAVY